MEWAEWFEAANRIIKSDMINGVHVSTVFIGIGVGSPFDFDNSRPLIFETMIFGGDNDRYQAQYSTYDEAELGHQKAVNIVNGSDILNQII